MNKIVVPITCIKQENRLLSSIIYDSLSFMENNCIFQTSYVWGSWLLHESLEYMAGGKIKSKIKICRYCEYSENITEINNKY